MSGGSYNYIYATLSEECEGQMHDPEMDELIKDLCKVLHDLEWWQSGDTSEEKYRRTLSVFKRKWFGPTNGEREKKLKKYIDNQIGITRIELYKMLGAESEAEE